MRRLIEVQSLEVRRGIVVLLVVHLLVVLAMASSPGFHKWIHHDADDGDHECAVTLFAHGGSTDAPALAAVVIAFVIFGLCLSESFCPVWVENLVLCSGIFEHAPPTQS